METRVDPNEWAKHVPVPLRPQIVVGGPGTGKTEFLARRIASAVTDSKIDPRAILVVSFSRRGVTDLTRRVGNLLGNTASQLNISTYHSLAMRIVESRAIDLGWDHVPTVLTAAEQERYAADVLASESPSAWPAGYGTLLESSAMAGEVTNFILRCHEQLVTADHLGKMADPRFVAMASFMARYNERLRIDHRTDYGRIVTEAVEALQRWPEIAAQYDLVVADEYQDSSPAQAEMIFLLSARTRNLVVAADPYQSIFSFRGTDINNVFSFPQVAKDKLGTDTERLVLTTSHRVPAEILDAAVSVTGRELPGGAGKVKSTRSGGVVASHVFSTLPEEAEWIASDIERIHLIDGVPLERIAVFIRSHSALANELSTSLGQRSITHTLAASRLTEEPIVRFLLDLVSSCVTEDDETHEAMKRVLMSPFIGMPYGAVNELARRVEEGASWPEVVSAGVPQGNYLAGLLAQPRWATHRPAPSGMWHVWSTIPQLVSVALDDVHGQDRRAWSAFSQVLTRLNERSPGTTLAQHADLVTGSDFEDDSLFAFEASDQGGVTIASLHGSKGTEFDVVFIANAVEGALPDLRTRDSLLGTRLLNPHLPSDTNDYVAFRLDEERRLAYTAMTRATSRVVWTATLNDEAGVGTQPSRFLSLVAPITHPPNHSDPLTPRSFEASLRRTAKNPHATRVDRLAAIEVLARGSEVGLHDPLARYGVAEFGRDDGVIRVPLRLSPSQATTFAECPRKYAVERNLLARQQSSVYLQFGTLIHHVLEEAERAAIDGGRERSTRSEAQNRLDAAWETLGFGQDAVGMSWRFRAETTLDNLYEKWPTSGAPVALEKELPLEIAGVDWVGRADRIERRGDDLFVIDYKTSGSAAKVADAKNSIQLGYYFKAATSDADLMELGPIAGAEFWYPRAKPNKNSIATRFFSPPAVDEVTDRLAEITEAIQSEKFEPTPGNHCKSCSVALVCPALDVGSEAFSQ